jgi:hypothetical protein
MAITPRRWCPVAHLLAYLAMAMAAGPARAIDSFTYDPPERSPKGELSRFVPENPDSALKQVWVFIEQEQGFVLESVNPKNRVLVARYSGDPRPFLDCGKVTAFADGKPLDPPRVYSANRPEVRTSKNPKNRRVGLLRQLKLDARLVVRVEPRGTGARVYANSIYVATKSVNRLRKGGRADELVDREVISFQSNEIGRFEVGTQCIANGKLESLPLNLFLKTS